MGRYKDLLGGIELLSVENMLKDKHPCFSHKAHFKYGRIHLPVAPRCNIRCRYCVRETGSPENRPGVTEKILSPSDALKKLRSVIKQNISLRVVAVAGPGEPLANPETFETLYMTKKEFPHLIRCIATNGLFLKESIEELKRAGVHTITVTANAVDPEIGKNIYKYVILNGKRYDGKEGAEILIERQKSGVKEAVSRGMIVKINTVFIPHINSDHIVEIAKTYSILGASVMNIMPLIPVGEFSHIRPPTHKQIEDVQLMCERYIEQFKLCKQCRADACGIPGLEGKENESLGSACI